MPYPDDHERLAAWAITIRLPGTLGDKFQPAELSIPTINACVEVVSTQMEFIRTVLDIAIVATDTARKCLMRSRGPQGLQDISRRAADETCLYIPYQTQ